MKNISFLVAILFLVSCTSNTIYKKPDDLIPKDSMVILIQEMVVANAAKNVKNINLQKKINYFPFVFDRFNIDSARFQKSNFYYTSKIEEYEEIFKEVKRNLKKEKDKYATIKKVKDSIRRDSINKIRGIIKPIKKDEKRK